jgi:hypothetical protein
VLYPLLEASSQQLHHGRNYNGDVPAEHYRYSSKLSPTLLQAVAGMFLCAVVETQGPVAPVGERERKRTRCVLALAQSRHRKQTHPGHKA